MNYSLSPNAKAKYNMVDTLTISSPFIWRSRPRISKTLSGCAFQLRRARRSTKNTIKPNEYETMGRDGFNGWWSLAGGVRSPFCVSLVEQRMVETQKVSLGLLWKGRLAGRLGQLLKSSLQQGRLRYRPWLLKVAFSSHWRTDTGRQEGKLIQVGRMADAAKRLSLY